MSPKIFCYLLLSGSLLAVASASAETTGQQEYKVTIPLTLDASGNVFRAFRVNDVPTILIADADGRILRRIEGSASRDATALRTAIDTL
jgi:hypothetical protein